MLTFFEARARLLASVRRVDVERVPLERAAGRVLAADAIAEVPLPRFDFSAMDGYALAAASGVGPRRAGSIPDANGPMLAALAAACGAVATRRHVVADELEATRRAVADALAEADVLVTAGGVSVGEHDLMRAALTAEGVAFDVV